MIRMICSVYRKIFIFTKKKANDMAIENDEKAQVILQGIDRLSIMIILGHIAKLTHDPEKTVNDIFYTIKESLMSNFSVLSEDESFIFETLSNNARQEYESMLDDLIASYKEPIIEMSVTKRKPVKTKK